MKRKNGFTLIELLAIIVILAVIAVITVPIILNIIDNSKKGAKLDSAYGFKDAIQNYYLSKSTNNTSEEVPTGTYSVSDLPEDFKVNGETPSDGWVTLEKGKVVAYSLQFSDYVVTKEVNSDPVAEKNGTLAPNPGIKIYEIGDTVDYSTSLNGVTLDDWKLFYKEGDYAYLIISNFLPNSAVVGMSGILRDSSRQYGVFSSTSRAALINALTNKSNWSELVTNGTVKGKSINQTVSDDVWAMGSPTIELLTDSWNTVHPDNLIYTAIRTEMDDGMDGYYVGSTENPSTITSFDFGTATIYAPNDTWNTDDPRYYFLASPAAACDRLNSSADVNTLILAIGTGYFGSAKSYLLDQPYNYASIGIRPVIRLPYSALN